MTGKGEAPAVARGLGPRVVGHQSTATDKTQSPPPNLGLRGWQSCFPGKPGFLVVSDGGYQPRFGAS